MNEHDPSLLAALQCYCAQPLVPMHMPGHKRNAALLGGALPYGLDVTEVGPFDALHAPDGPLSEAMDRATRVYGSVRTHFLVNGASGGLLAGIRALTRPGGRAVVAQNSHRAVFHALELCQVMPEYVAPRWDAAFDLAGSVEPPDVAAALDRTGDASLVVVTSPTYEGCLSDIRGIADIAHARGALLLVDEAHGAHLPFSPRFPDSAMALGADIVVQSVHKVLPSLTQTAVLHICSDRVDPREVQRQLSIFETTSPSFLLLTSIDECVRRMAAEGCALLSAHADRLDAFSEAVRGLKHLRVRGHGADGPHPARYALDRTKILVSCAGTGMNGDALSRQMLDEYGIALEMSMGDAALAMTTCCDPAGAIERVAEALVEIDGGLLPPLTQSARRFSNTPSIERAAGAGFPGMAQVLLIDEALRRDGAFVPLSTAAGRICAEYIWAYPPGVPLLAPGARISGEAAAHIAAMMRRGTRLFSTSGALPGAVRVC